MFRILSIGVAIASIVLSVITYSLYKVPDPPQLDFDKWWGTGPKPDKEDTSIRPFNIEFQEEAIADLRQRLKNRRPFTRSLEGIQSEYGINTEYLNLVLDFWMDKYNFTRRAELLNRHPHYKTRIQGLDLHFIRAKPENLPDGIKVLPLLMLHGWPSSSKEFVHVIPLLTTPKHGYDFVFEIIAVDLPGYGYSEATNKPGLNVVQIAIIMRNLMKRLGFEKYYIQAGDWGSQTATHLSTLFPDDVLGFHTNMLVSSRPISIVKLLIGSLFPTLIVEPENVERVYPIKKIATDLIKESGYFHIQATKPDTVGVALTDSPAGLAAYLMEKIAICCNRDELNTPHGGLDNLGLEDVLDTVTIQWMNSCAVTSMRLYAESVSTSWPETGILHNIPTKVPTAAVNFRYEVVYQPAWILRDKFPNLVRFTTFDFGGHFAALQTPVALVDDLYASVAEFIKFHKTNGEPK